VNCLARFTIAHFTVVCLLPWPLKGSEAGVDFGFVTNLPSFHMDMIRNLFSENNTICKGNAVRFT